MLPYILLASSEASHLTLEASPLLEMDDQTVTFSIGGVLLKLSKRVIRKHLHSDFNGLLNCLENHPDSVCYDRNGHVLIPIVTCCDREGNTLTPIEEIKHIHKANLRELVAYIKEFMETGTLKDFDVPSDKLTRNYHNLLLLAKRLSLESLETALERFNPRSAYARECR